MSDDQKPDQVPGAPEASGESGAPTTVLPSGATIHSGAGVQGPTPHENDPDKPSGVSRRGVITATAAGLGVLALGGGGGWWFWKQQQSSALSASGSNNTVTVDWSQRELPLILGSGVCEAPQYAAYEKGIFEEAGLNVKLVKAGKEEDTKEALGSGKYVASNGIFFSFLGPIYNGLDVKLTTGLHQGCLRLVVPSDSDITDVAQLKGRKIGVSSLQGSATNFFALDLLDAGISSNPEDGQVDWQVIEDDLLPQALKDGRVDAIAASDPTALKATYDGSAKELTNNREGANAQEYCCAIALNGQFVREDPVTARKLVTAWAEGSRWVGSNLEETAQIESEKNYVAASAEDILPQLQSYGFDPSSKKLRDSFVPGIQKFAKTGFLDADVNAEALADQVWVDLGLNW